MRDNSQIFFNKKILIYGLGKSGLSSFNFLKNKSEVYFFDYNLSRKGSKSFKKKILKFKELLNIKFDLIINLRVVNFVEFLLKSSCKKTSLLFFKKFKVDKPLLPEP